MFNVNIKSCFERQFAENILISRVQNEKKNKMKQNEIKERKYKKKIRVYIKNI